jgi:hypothetical protein
MKAARFSAFGGPEVLQIVGLPDPHPGPGQVRVGLTVVLQSQSRIFQLLSTFYWTESFPLCATSLTAGYVRHEALTPLLRTSGSQSTPILTIRLVAVSGESSSVV